MPVSVIVHLVVFSLFQALSESGGSGNVRSCEDTVELNKRKWYGQGVDSRRHRRYILPAIYRVKFPSASQAPQICLTSKG